MQVSEAELQALLARFPRWHGPAVNWSVRFTLRGPGWIPFQVRKLPLQALSAMTGVYIRLWRWL